jgi:glycosyltransferase involved in cell wall biosynthesis
MKAPRSVLFLHPRTDFTAEATVHSHLMRHLPRDRYAVHVACTPSDGVGESYSMRKIREIPDISIRPTHFAPGIRERTAREVLLGVKASVLFPIDFIALARYVRRHRIELIHTAERPRDALYNVALARLTGAKSVVHVHVKWADWYTKQALWAVRNADGIFSISRFVTDSIVAMKNEPERVHTVLNCVDTAGWDPELDGSSIREEFGIAPDDPLIVAVSRLFEWKGEREIVRALPRVRARIPRARLLIVGEDEVRVHGGSFTADLRAEAQKLGVGEFVSFAGKRQDIPRIMAAANVFCLPSREEPFGLVYLEAMAMKRPVVALDEGGVPEVVEHGRSGLLSKRLDNVALADNLVALLEDPALAARMGEHGRRRVVDYFNAQRMANDAADAYDKILGV